MDAIKMDLKKAIYSAQYISLGLDSHFSVSYRILLLSFVYLLYCKAYQ